MQIGLEHGFFEQSVTKPTLVAKILALYQTVED